MDIQQNVSLKPYNTFQVATNAAHFVTVNSLDEFIELTEQEIWQTTDQRFILGGGSNILLTQERFDGLVVKNEITGKEVITENDDEIIIKVGAGDNRDEFVDWTIDNEYRGLENLKSIPGTVGAAPMQNIGAYGLEVEQFVNRVSGHDRLVHRTKHMPHDECCFGYRTSLFKKGLNDRFFISHVTFKLPKYDPDTYQPVTDYGAVSDELAAKGVDQSDLTPQLLAETIATIRARKLPDRNETGTAGSFFKNPVVNASTFEKLTKQEPDIHGYPVDTTPPQPSLLKETDEKETTNNKMYKLSAGQLIELAGLKGYRKGDVGTYDKHALVVVNHGSGSGPELLQFVAKIQDTVKEKFHIHLQPEVTII